MSKVVGVLEEIKEVLSYQVKLLEHLVENSGKRKASQNFDKVVERVSEIMLPKGGKNIIPKEVMDCAVKIVKEMHKEA